MGFRYKGRARRQCVGDDNRCRCARSIVHHRDRVGQSVSHLDRVLISDFGDRQVSLRHDGVGVHRDVDVGIAIQTGESLARRARERGRTAVCPSPIRRAGKVASVGKDYILLSGRPGDREGNRDHFHSVDQCVRPEGNTVDGIAENVIGRQLPGNLSFVGKGGINGYRWIGPDSGTPGAADPRDRVGVVDRCVERAE